MKKFELPPDLKFNRGFILNPSEYLKDAGCASWLFLVGEEFAEEPDPDDEQDHQLDGGHRRRDEGGGAPGRSCGKVGAILHGPV